MNAVGGGGRETRSHFRLQLSLELHGLRSSLVVFSTGGLKG